MRIRNSTDWHDYFLRRMVAWCCRQVDYPPSRVRAAQFRKRTQRRYSGHAYGSRRIVCSIGPAETFPCGPDRRPGLNGMVLADPLECLVALTSHELAHLHQYASGRSRGLSVTRKTEFDARWHEVKALEAFRANRAALLAEWSAAPAERSAKPKASVQEKRAAKAQADLDRWTRKLKLAQTKIKKLKAKVRRYERIAACRAEST